MAMRANLVASLAVDHALRHPWHYVYRALLVFFLCLLGFFVFENFSYSKTVTHISATTEVIAFDQGKATALAIPLDEAQVTFPDGSVRCLYRASITPAPNAMVRYIRPSNGPLAINIDPGADSQAAGTMEGHDTPARFDGPFIAQILAPACQRRRDGGGFRIMRYPLSGSVIIGRDFALDSNGHSLTLLSGKIQTFVRALPSLFGIPIAGSQGVIIPAQSVEIPAGSMLFECAPGTQRVPWSGFVEARMGGAMSEERALTVSAITSALRLALVTPGGAELAGSNCGDGAGANAQVDVIGLSVMGRMVADPNALIITIILGLMISLIETMVSIHGLPIRIRK